MSQFIGTKDEFIKYIGGYCRNKVNAITRNERLLHNKTCQHCKTTNVELESAHVLGQERNKIIETILESCFKINENYYEVDLSKFEKLFIDFQTPVNEHFLFLCKDCHSKYDAKNKIKNNISKGEKEMHLSNTSINKNAIDIIEKYKSWLGQKGYKFSTINQYYWGINQIVNEEQYFSWQEVVNNINKLMVDYNTFGSKGHIGEMGHKSVINALRRFKEFLLDTSII